jgi:sugar lactone lactonase YvrE
MKNSMRFILLATVVGTILAGCERIMNPVSEADISSATQQGLSFKKDGEPISDIKFYYKGFTASVFYDQITGPDGIATLKNGKLLVVKEYGDPGPAVLKVKEGDTFSAKDALSTIGAPFNGPDDLALNADKEIYVADGQAQTVFRLPHSGGTPEAFVTTTTTGTPGFQPFGTAIAPAKFDGPNVDPGDLIIADNDYFVWAVNPLTGRPNILAGGKVFEDGPISLSFSANGTLFVFENYGKHGTNRIVTLSPDGKVEPFITGINGVSPSMAIHLQSDMMYFKYSEGEIWRVSTAKGGKPERFAANIGVYQDIEFSEDGTTLYISARGRRQVIRISGDVQAWSASSTASPPVVVVE